MKKKAYEVEYLPDKLSDWHITEEEIKDAYDNFPAPLSDKLTQPKKRGWLDALFIGIVIGIILADIVWYYIFNQLIIKY